MHYVSSKHPRLAPIFRSDTQLQILGATYLEPARRFTIPDLVERSSRPQPTAARGMDRLAEAGLSESELRSGGNHGEAGALPQDVDVLVIGSGDVSEIRAEAEAATQELGRDVNVTVLTSGEWDSPGSGFIEHIKNGPLVDLDLKQ